MKWYHVTILALITVIGVLIFFQWEKSCEKPQTPTNTVQNGSSIVSVAQEAMEYAYFEGQKDAINGDVRIKLIQENNTYVWIKSPWSSGKDPVFIPTAKDTQLERDK